jgi:RNA polymerase sigma-70 factor (ECF subfamily)
MEKRAAMNEQASERQLIEACRQGDREAFRQLFETYNDRVWSIALHFTGDETAARDITQQVFLKLFTSIGQFRFDARFATWLYRLVINACLDERRRHRRFIPLDFLGNDKRGDEAPGEPGKIDAVGVKHALHWRTSPGWSSHDDGDDRLSKLETSAMVKAAVKELKPKLRIAILLKYFEGLSYEEMAQALGCSIGTVASRLNRGHQELARKLAHLQRK